MGSSDRLFNTQRTVHQILGGGLVADVMLWRISTVLLLLFTILFLWAKSATILNRPAPPLPHLHLSEETANEAAAFIRDQVNTVLSVSEDIAYGRDSRMFVKVGLMLLLISVVRSLTDFFTLSYICLVVLLTVPPFYERYEDLIEMYALKKKLT
ncbi:reticulon-like protein B12 [Salvia divinorum]|uniref:Reticulon-like protein n=1 Tax=Salvia divinorum TaxID=28513 RepID=A0ABD1GQY8_SALDI